MGFIDDKRSVSEQPIKPRRTKGTVAHKARNRFAIAVIAGSIVLGAIYMILPSTNKIRESVQRRFFEESDEHKFRKYSMPFVGGKKSSVDIETLMKELGRPLEPEQEKPSEH